jgi:hypothetical protein
LLWSRDFWRARARECGKSCLALSFIYRWRNSSFIHFKSVKILIFSRSTIFLAGFLPNFATDPYNVGIDRSRFPGVCLYVTI